MKSKFLFIGLAIATGWMSCNEMDRTHDPNVDQSTRFVLTKSVPPQTYCGTSTQVRLMFGQNTHVGYVTVGNTPDSLYVTYTTFPNYVLNSAELFVGSYADLLNVSTPSMNPQVGLFPYKQTFSPPVSSYTFAIALSALPDTVWVAAHANVTDLSSTDPGSATQTSWGEGQGYGGAQWAMRFMYVRQICTPEPPVVYTYQYETAWVSGTRYVNRGNWATYVTYTNGLQVPIYAGQTIPVGTASFTLDTVLNKVRLQMNLSGGWALQSGGQTVKIQGYTTPPTRNPAPGTFTTSKGNLLDVLLPIFPYYGIHLEVVKATPVQ